MLRQETQNDMHLAWRVDASPGWLRMRALLSGLYNPNGDCIRNKNIFSQAGRVLFFRVSINTRFVIAAVQKPKSIANCLFCDTNKPQRPAFGY